MSTSVHQLGSDPILSAAFQLDKVTCRFGEQRAVDQVSLSIHEGEQLALIGPSGSGKTTLISLLNTTRRPDGGTTRILDGNVSRMNPRELQRLRTRIATIPQHLGLVPNLTAVQNIILGQGGARGTFRSVRDLLFPSKADLIEIHSLLERVGIEEKLYARVSRLSGGEQQRVAIARAIFQRPEALLADEPVSSIDPERARAVMRLLTELSTEHGFILCVSLHHLSLAKEFFPRVVGMRSGKIVYDGSPRDFNDAAQDMLYELHGN